MSTNLKNGYGISLNEWVLDNDIKNELRLILIISSLSANKGFSNATNTYFAELFEETEESISRKINKLIKKGYLEVEYDKKGTAVIGRRLRLTKLSMADDKIINGVNNIKINKENNIIINNNNIAKEKFKEPSLEDIQKYIDEKKLNVIAKDFYDYFEAGNWKDSKGKKVKNWKQKIITWSKYYKKSENKKWWEEDE